MSALICVSGAVSLMHDAELQVEDLLDAGANVNEQDAYGETALHGACLEGHLDVVHVLVVEQRAQLEIQNWEGWVPLICAVVRGHTAVAKFLIVRVRAARQVPHSRFAVCVRTVRPLRAWSKPLARQLQVRQGCKSVHRNMRAERRCACVQGSTLSSRTFIGWTPLHFAALQSNLALMEYMLEEGAEALASGKDGCLPSDCATHPEIRSLLYTAGAARTFHAVPPRFKCSMFNAWFSNGFTGRSHCAVAMLKSLLSRR